MSDRPSNNLHEVFGRVLRLMGEPFSAVDLLGPSDQARFVWRGSFAGCSDCIAENEIIAACVRWLLDHSMGGIEMSNGSSQGTEMRFRVDCSRGWEPEVGDGPTLAIALLLAVEASAKDNK